MNGLGSPHEFKGAARLRAETNVEKLGIPCYPPRRPVGGVRNPLRGLFLARTPPARPPKPALTGPSKEAVIRSHRWSNVALSCPGVR